MSTRSMVGGGLPRGGDEPAQDGPGNRALYLYGVVRRPDAAETRLGTGVGDPPAGVFLLPFRRIAAVVSDVSADAPPGSRVRGLRRDMSAHTDLLNRLREATTVLPVRFGVCVKDREALVEGVLRPQYDRLDEQLNRLAGAVELTLHVRYREEAILQEVRKEQPMLTRRAGGLRFRSQRTFEEKMERGRRIVETMRTLGQRDSRRLLEKLEPLARRAAVEEPPSELTVLKAEFLVDRPELERFDRAVEALHEELQSQMEFDYVGPLPPYSFTRMELPAV